EILPGAATVTFRRYGTAAANRVVARAPRLAAGPGRGHPPLGRRLRQARYRVAVDPVLAGPDLRARRGARRGRRAGGAGEALRRLSRTALERGDRERARHYFAELVALEPDYLVYASDYVALGTLQLEASDGDAARATWLRGAEVYPRNADIRRLLAEHFDESPPEVAPNIPPVREEELGVRRIPVRTEMITARTGVIDVVDRATAELRGDGA